MVGLTKTAPASNKRKYMNEISYRIGIQQDKVIDWRAKGGRGSAPWYSDYKPELEAVQALANQIKRDLEKFRICESKHGSGLRPRDKLVASEKREQIIRAALAQLANAGTA